MIDYKKFGQIITSYVEDYNNTLNKKLLMMMIFLEIQYV